MEVVRVDDDCNHLAAGFRRRIFPQRWAAELHEFMRNRIPPLRDDKERMAPIDLCHHVLFDAVISSDDGFSLFEEAAHSAAAYGTQRKKWDRASGARHDADTSKNDG